ncbi:MAG: hypothetical protein LBR10_04210 [Prevotellaceae bacterium]|jgi:hypothetical protein|nr:hypothetical protein [Prevotellaceae bacterium]
MRFNVIVISFLLFLSVQIQAQNATTEKDLIAEKTELVATRLKLDETKKQSVYNVLSQTDKRIKDLAQGTADYAKLINYIDQERNDMLKVALSQEEFSLYQKNFMSKDKAEITAYISKNNAFIAKKANAELKAKQESEKLMKADKAKMEKEEAKAKIAAKKAAEKSKNDEKKAAAKQKLADKKEKDKLKKEADKQKAADKKAADKQKALEKKQKELEKKLNKK